MTGKYRAYPDYKNSGIEWLGDIPEGWEVFRGKFVFNEFAERSETGDEELLSVSEYYGVKPRGEVIDEGDFLSRAESLVGYKKCYKNDLVMNIMLAWKRGLGVTKYDGIVSPAYSVFRFHENASPDYMHYLLRTDLYTGHFKTRSTGVIDSRLRLYPESFANVPIMVPQLPEQEQIANFLDYETAKIDTLIDKQQQLIKLLKEKRQAVISHAVTKGLNPAAPMKDSGVDWLGDVPEHWVIISLGKITEDKCDGPFGSGLKSEHYTESGVLVVRLQNIKSGGYHEGEGAFIDENYYKYYLSNHDVVAGDVLIAGLGDPNNPVGRACVAPENIEPAMVKADCFRFRLNRKKVIPNFVARQLSVSAHVDAGRLSNGSTRARIPLNLMATRKVAICPLAEQGQILEHINALSEQYDKLEEAASKAVSLLQDRRTALISAAVTGKIDVRNWQPVGRERLITPPVLPLS